MFASASSATISARSFLASSPGHLKPARSICETKSLRKKRFECLARIEKQQNILAVLRTRDPVPF
jgi:hypothetical protein